MIISKGVKNIKPAQLRYCSEDAFLRKLRDIFEKEGWFTWRIKDVKDTGMRVSDVFVNVNGTIQYVETKISALPLEKLLVAPQETFCTTGQRLHNHIVQKHNTGFFYVIRSIKCSEPLTLLYVSDTIELEQGIKPTIALTIPELIQYFKIMGASVPNYRQTLEGFLNGIQ